MKMNQRSKVTDKSEFLYQKRLSDRLGKIFELFDYMNKGRVTADDISLDDVPLDIIMIFKPLLLEMETYEESLDKEEFVESAISLLQRLTIKEKNTILKFGAQNEKEEK